jgi:hypothetical protein
MVRAQGKDMDDLHQRFGCYCDISNDLAAQSRRASPSWRRITQNLSHGFDTPGQFPKGKSSPSHTISDACASYEAGDRQAQPIGHCSGAN